MNDKKKSQYTGTGADLLLRSLEKEGIDTCFANPGTSEMHLVTAIGKSS